MATFLFFSFLSSVVFAQTDVLSDRSRAVTLSEIDELIEQTDYNHALADLTEYIKLHPTEFDSAQKRVDHIMKARQSYNKLAAQLIEVMQNEPENDEKKLQIIAKLESLEKYPTEKNLAFIRQAKIAAQFTFFRAQFKRIMDSGVELVNEKKYTEAANKFSEGFVLYRGDFDDKNYDKSVTEPVLKALDTIKKETARLAEMQNICMESYNAFMQAVAAGNYELSRSAFVKVQSAFKQYADVRNSVARSGKVFMTTFTGLQKQDPELTEASFLAFAQRFTLGRANDSDSGIVGAMDALWNNMVESMKPAVYNAVGVNLKNLESQLVSETLFDSPAEYSDARSALARAKQFSSIGNDVQSLYSLLEDENGKPVSEKYTQYRNSMKYMSDMTDRFAERLDDVRSLSNLNSAADARLKNASLSSASQSVFSSGQLSSVSDYEKIRLNAENALKSQWFTDEVEKEAVSAGHENDSTTGAVAQKENVIRTTSGVQIDDNVLSWQPTNSLYEKICSLTADAAKNGASGSWGALAKFYADSSSSVLAELTVRYTDADGLLNGLEEKDEETGTSLVKKYPNECVLSLDKLQTDISSVKNIFSRYLRTLGGGESYVSSSAQYENGINTIKSNISALDKLSSSGKSLASTARVQIQLAERAKNEASLRYSEASAALKKNNFDEARNNLQRARTKYNESLSYQESARLRKQSDSDLETLGAEIARQENEFVVKEVRSLKTDAKNAYYQGDFENAEKKLIQARTRWAVTNVDEDKEITNLLALVSTALSMKTGRVIPPTAPLYPEMSQILSIANQYYDSGADLIKKGKMEEAKAVLNQAKEKLRSLQLVYPLNQEASLLTLRIDNLIDPSSFKAMFEQKVNAAKQDYKNPDKRQTAYTDLLDLYEINPSYPGLKKLINDVEIAIGVKQKPVDRTELNRSKTLTSEAQKIYDSAGRNEIQLRAALSKLDEAIRLNPNNDSAMLLKDRIQTSIGGKAAVVLSSADEAVYQQAIQELQKNNIVTANALVEQLLQKPANRRSSKILDLQKKVKALL